MLLSGTWMRCEMEFQMRTSVRALQVDALQCSQKRSQEPTGKWVANSFQVSPSGPTTITPTMMYQYQWIRSCVGSLLKMTYTTFSSVTGISFTIPRDENVV